MDSKIKKIILFILLATLVLTDLAPQWQLKASHDESLEAADTEASESSGQTVMVPETSAPVRTQKPADNQRLTGAERGDAKASSQTAKSQRAGSGKKAGKKKSQKKKPAFTPEPTYRPIDGTVLSENEEYASALQELKQKNTRVTKRRAKLLTKKQSLTVRQAYLKEMAGAVGDKTLAVKVAATGTAVSEAVSAAAIQGMDAVIDQIVYGGYILCDPNYMTLSPLSGMDVLFSEETLDLGLYLNKELRSCRKQLKQLEKPVSKLKKRYRRIHSAYVSEKRLHNRVCFDPENLLVKSGATVRQMRQMLEGSELYSLAPVFVKAEKRYGINAVGMASIAALESGWGTSRRAKQDNNLTGFGVYSDDAVGINAASRKENILQTARWLAENYLQEDGIYYEGLGLPELNLHYSASYTWAWKVEHCAQEMFGKLEA